MVKSEKLGAISLFADLPSEELQALCSQMTEVRVAKGTVLLHASDGAGTLLFVLEGAVRALFPQSGDVASRSHVIEKGGVFGEIALLARQPQKAELIAEADTVALLLSEETFERHSRRFSGLLRALSRELALRIFRQ